MSEKNTGGPAFPVTRDDVAQNDAWGGMDLRDYLAAKALAGWMSTYATDAQHPCGKDSPQEWADAIAEASYRLADAMLRARST